MVDTLNICCYGFTLQFRSSQNVARKSVRNQSLHRPWSSSSNVNSSKKQCSCINMNSSEEISKYGRNYNNYYSPISGSEIIHHGNSPKSLKKERKWSFGGFFRRKKKNDSDSTSEDEHRKKKRSHRPSSKANITVGFDHIVISSNFNNDNRRRILSESDSKGTQNFIPASEIIRPSRKCKRENIKARAEARIRDNSKGDGSSEEDSPFKSDESSTSSSRKTRTARTQRYLRRHSKDGEVCITNFEDFWKPPSRFSGLSTIPPPSHRAITTKCEYDVKNRFSVSNNQRSVSYDGNIHHQMKIPSAETVVIHAQLPLGFPINVLNHRIGAPPPPPPRDPNRMMNMQNGETRPTSYSFEPKTNSDQHLHRLNPRINRNRSTSEDQLSVFPHETVLVSRPSSATPKLNDYRYLTDKNPRSRKPICVMQPNSFDFWRQKEDIVNTSPVMFTAKTHVTTSIFPQSDNHNKNLTSSTDQHNSIERNSFQHEVAPMHTSLFKVVENESRKSTNLEEALDELEAIYKSLHLGDEELLDRATERESTSEPSLKPKIKIEPDPKSDDMAYRKFGKERNNSGSDSLSPGSYLLASPVFGVNFDEFHKSTTTKEPDTTFDDVVYRNVKHTNNALRVVEPQPPFGIPVGPVLPSANSDYLHAAPLSYKKSKKIPDIVKDDLAYRNLRKDPNKEPALPQTYVSREDYLNNNNNSNYKKKRAVRSFSANIFNLVQQNQKLNVFETEQDIDDVADALEMARKILKDKEDKINATRKAFMSDGELKNNKLGSSRSCRCKFLGVVDKDEHLQLDTKPPRSPKPSTPIPPDLSDEDVELERALQHSTLEELLTSLARETSEHITYGLNTLDEPRHDVKHNGSERDTFTSNDSNPCTVEAVGVSITPSVVCEEEHDYVNIHSNSEDERNRKEPDQLQNKIDCTDLNNIKQLEVTENKVSDKPGGEECVNIKYIALPTNGCTYVNKSTFKFESFDCKNAANLIDANHSKFNELTNSLTQLIESSMNMELNALGEVTSDNCDSHSVEKTNFLSDEACSLNKIESTSNLCLGLDNVTLQRTQALNDQQSNMMEFKLGPLRSEQREISHIDTDFDSLKSPKLVQNLNGVCNNETTSKSDDQKDSRAVTNHSWYDPSVIAIACSCGIACTYQLPFDLIAALGLLFAVISMLLAIITRI